MSDGWVGSATPYHIAISQYFKMPLKCHKLPVFGSRNGSLTFPLQLREPHRQRQKVAPNIGCSSPKLFSCPLTLHVYLFKAYNELGNRDSLVDIRSRLQARRSGVGAQAGKRDFSVLQQRPHWLWSSICLFFSGYWCLYSLKKTIWGVRLTSHSIYYRGWEWTKLYFRFCFMAGTVKSLPFL